MWYRFVSSDRCHTYNEHSIFMIHWNWIFKSSVCFCKPNAVVWWEQHRYAMVSISDNIRIVCIQNEWKSNEEKKNMWMEKESDDDFPWALAALHIFLMPYTQRRYQIRSMRTIKEICCALCLNSVECTLQNASNNREQPQKPHTPCIPTSISFYLFFFSRCFFFVSALI